MWEVYLVLFPIRIPIVQNRLWNKSAKGFLHHTHVAVLGQVCITSLQMYRDTLHSQVHFCRLAKSTPPKRPKTTQIIQDFRCRNPPFSLSGLKQPRRASYSLNMWFSSTPSPTKFNLFITSNKLPFQISALTTLEALVSAALWILKYKEKVKY